MTDREYKNLNDTAYSVVSSSLMRFLEKNADNDNDLLELKVYFDDAERQGVIWDMEKAKIVLSVLKSKNKEEIKKVLSYLDCSECGWQGGEYRLYNRCLRHDRRCKTLVTIDNTPEATEDVFSSIDEIFLHKKYGGIVSYIFGYCIVALFSSRLKQESLRIPYFLQIGCERNSNMYRLIHEIVDICDINTGLQKNCCYKDFDYGYCDYDHVTVFPSQSANNILDNLLYYRDIPIIIDGFENEKFYISLLREVANIPGRIKKLDMKDRFNVLPIFVCSSIKSSFKNVFSIDLSNLEIDSDYLELLEANKQNLSSWVFELVASVNEYFEQRNSLGDKVYNRGKDKCPLFDNISGHINRLRKEYRKYIKLTVSDMTNIGYITYFFSRFMEVFRRSLRLSDGTVFVYRCAMRKHNPKELIAKIVSEVTVLLLELHNDCSPLSQSTPDLEVVGFDSKEIKNIKKKCAKYAKDIIKFYQSYRVSITIKKVEYKDYRYIFWVEMLPGTEQRMISRYADEIRRLLDVKFFVSDITPSSIRLIASERPLQENSLCKILESQAFRENTMEIPYAVGYDVMGEMVIADVAKFPHLLIGGTSGSGKSSALHSLLMSIACKQPADKVKLLLIDFGASGLKVFDRVPHMLQPTIKANEVEKARQCISRLHEIMEDRLNTKDSSDVNTFTTVYKKWPSIVCVIDEFPAFIQQLPDRKGSANSRVIIEDLLARARKVKIHLILTAQDTTKEGIGIKNTNLAAGIAFKCTNWHTSKVIIGESDAVNLSGEGAMYFRHNGLKRLQGSFILEDDIEGELDKINFFYSETYDGIDFQLDSVQGYNDTERRKEEPTIEDKGDALLLEMVVWLQDKEDVSNNQIKHKFKMGYDVAKRFLSQLEDAGIVSPGIKGERKARMVYPEKVNEFLNRHGDTGSASGATPNQVLDSSDMPTDVESTQDQDTEPPEETSDAQEQLSSSAVSQPKPPKFDADAMKKLSVRGKIGRKSTH